MYVSFSGDFSNSLSFTVRPTTAVHHRQFCNTT